MRSVGIVLVSILVGVAAAVGFDAARSSTTEVRTTDGEPTADASAPQLEPWRDVVLPLPEPRPGRLGRTGASPEPGPGPGPKLDPELKPDLAEPLPVGAPASVTLPSSSATIKVVPVGTGTDGQLHPPSDGQLAGWWAGGPRPGEPGRALLVGHVDTKDGLGAFAGLHDAEAGDGFEVTSADGRQQSFEVTSVREITKQALTAADLTGGPSPELLLVTCTGEFDRVAQHYESNLLVLATPV